MMNAIPLKTPGICPECGAKVAANASRCWICNHPFAGDVPVAAELVGGATAHRATFQFGISSILLIITLAAVILGVYQMAPGIGIALAIVVIPAMIPTCIIAIQKGARGRPMTPSEKISLFMLWLGLAAVVLIAACVAFIATCSALVPAAGRRSYGAAILNAAISANVAIVVAILLVWLSWRIFKWKFQLRDNRKREPIRRDQERRHE